MRGRQPAYASKTVRCGKRQRGSREAVKALPEPSELTGASRRGEIENDRVNSLNEPRLRYPLFSRPASAISNCLPSRQRLQTLRQVKFVYLTVLARRQRPCKDSALIVFVIEVAALLFRHSHLFTQMPTPPPSAPASPCTPAKRKQQSKLRPPHQATKSLPTPPAPASPAP